MVRSLSFFVFVLMISCHGKQERYTEFVFSDQQKFKWDNELCQVVSDADYQRMKGWYHQNKFKFVSEMLDDTNTNARVHGVDESLKRGDLAFLFIDSIEDIPFYVVFEWQFDFLKSGCLYSNGVIEYVGANRKTAKNQVLNYLSP